MSNGFVIAEIDPKKATVWCGNKSSIISKQIMRSWYQSLDKKPIQVHVKFEGGLSIQFWRKKRYKKN
jgi:hypothetical protein